MFTCTVVLQGQHTVPTCTHLLIIKDLYSDVHLYLCVAGTAHCANMYPPTSSDPAALVQARASISKLIGKWIA